MSSDQRKDRLNRIKRRALPAVRDAYERGQITARRADILLHLNPREKALELERRLSEAHGVERKHRLVAGVIRQYLDALNGRRVDLVELAGIIRGALA